MWWRKRFTRIFLSRFVMTDPKIRVFYERYQIGKQKKIKLITNKVPYMILVLLWLKDFHMMHKLLKRISYVFVQQNGNCMGNKTSILMPASYKYSVFQIYISNDSCKYMCRTNISTIKQNLKHITLTSTE